jgi:vesicle-associated membrane protein 7
MFLNEIKQRFQTVYGSRADTALAYAMNTEFSQVLANEMVSFPGVVFESVCPS